MKITAIIAAGGSGERAKLGKNKLLYKINEKTILEETTLKFEKIPSVNDIMIIYNKDNLEEYTLALKGIKKPITFVEGGKTRTDSVRNALLKCTADIVLIHDGARPFVSKELINRCIDSVLENKSAVPALPVVDTLTYAQDNKQTANANRENLFAVQTPQCFYLKDILEAYKKMDKNETYTDDASLYTKFIEPAHLVKGEKENKKLTLKEDFMTNAGLKTGIGFDTHRLVENRKCIIGGVEIPHDKGLLGHSDADVLLHAIMDSLLSACGLKDIGYYFSDKDERFKDISSLYLLGEVKKLMHENGFKVINVSAVIMAEKPKMAKHIDEMKENIAKVLEIDKSSIGITATTTETLGYVGREEGISSQAISLIDRI